MSTKSKRKRDKDAEYEKKKRDRLNSLLNELSTLLQDRKIEFKSSFSKPTKEIVMNDARLYILELKRYLKALSPSVEDPINRSALSDEEISAGFTMLMKNQIQLYSRMGGIQDIQTANHYSNVMLELANKSSQFYLGIHAVAFQFVYWGVVVFNPYAAVERLTNFLPYYEKHKNKIPKDKMYIMDLHLDVLLEITFAVALIALGYMDSGMKHWRTAQKQAAEIGHPNTLGFVWAAMSIIKFHREESFTREEASELQSLLVGRWKPYFTFLMAASTVREAKTPDEESEGQQILVKSAEEAIQVYGSMNDLSIRARSLPVWLKSDPQVGLEVVKGMINRAEKTGATSCMMLSDLYRYKAEMLMSLLKSVESVAEIEGLLRLAIDIALQNGYSLSYLKCLKSLARLQAVTKHSNWKETLNTLHSMYLSLKRSSLQEKPSVLQEVEAYLKINGFIT